jgi:recombinational DNA repair protein (RecF pathway)
MAIEKYVTRAIILESYDQGEHDKAYKVFTREYGLLICQAKSIRKLESKLRAHMLPRSVSLITLVQGREVWRLVGAENEVVTSMYIHEVTTLLKRFVRGEGTHTALYDRMIAFLQSSSLYEEQSARLLLYYILLVDLGYADAKVIGVKSLKEYISFSVDDLYTYLLLNKAQVKAHVQAVLKEIQL